MGLLTDLLEKKIEQHHQDKMVRDQALRGFYYDRINDPNTDPAVKDELSQNYMKLLSPDAKKVATNGFGLLGKIKAAFGKGPQQQQDQTPVATGPIPPPSTGRTPPPTSTPSPATPLANTDPNFFKADPTANPKAAFMQGPPPVPTSALPAPAGTPPIAHLFQNYGTWDQKRKDDRLGQIADQAGLIGRDKALFVGSGGARLPPNKTTTVKSIARPGVGEDGKPFDGLWDYTKGPDGSETWAKRPEDTKGRPTILSNDVVTAEHATAMNKGGVDFHDEDGNPIDISKLPAGMVLQAVHRGAKTWYVPRDVQDRVIKTGNQTYAVSPYDVHNLPNGTGTDLGVTNPGATSSRDTTAIDPATGNPVVNTMVSKRTPSAPGVSGRGTATPASPPWTGTAPTPGSTPIPAPSGGASTLRGMPSGQYNQALQRATSVREGATQIFGDPQRPDMKGLIDYQDLADNADSRGRLGKVFRLILDSAHEAGPGAHISASAGPISVSTGGIGTVLTNMLGVPQKIAQQQSEIINKAIGSLTPREQEALDSTISSLSTIIGLRSLTRAPATQASMAMIERELPMIGVNTNNSKQFGDQMGRLAEVISNGVKGIPKGMLDQRLVDRISGLPSEMAAKNKKGPAKAPASKAADPLGVR